MLLKNSPETQRVMDVVASSRMEERLLTGDDQPAGTCAQLAHALRAKLGFAENPKLKERFATAGLRGASTSDMFFAAQFLMPLVGAFAGSFIPDNTVFWVFALAVVGYMTPGFLAHLEDRQAQEENSAAACPTPSTCSSSASMPGSASTRLCSA